MCTDCGNCRAVTVFGDAFSLCAGQRIETGCAGVVWQCSAFGERLLKDTKDALLKKFWGPKGYHWQACSRLKEAYAARVAGQDAHLASIARTVCRHISKGEQRVKPLVILITGPPGVGKTWTTRVTAQACFLTASCLAALSC